MTEAKIEDSLRLIVCEHLKASKQFVEGGDHPRLNVQANRIMTDATIIEDGRQLTCVGLVLRLAWFETNLTVVPRPPRFLLEYPQNAALVTLLDDLIRIAESVNQADVCAESWKSYERFYTDFWEASREKVEGRAYLRHPEFQTEAWSWCISHLSEWKGLIGQYRGSPISGTVNELNRISRAHGCDAKHLAILGMLQGLTWWHNIVLWKHSDRDNRPDNEAAMSEVAPYLDRILGVKSMTDDSMFYSEVSQLCVEIIGKWRESFIQYYDLHMATESSRPQLIAEGIQRPEKPARGAKGKKASEE